jgi:MerR family transcriptional regulator, thiopeptide resistance regulator
MADGLGADPVFQPRANPRAGRAGRRRTAADGKLRSPRAAPFAASWAGLTQTNRSSAAEMRQRRLASDATSGFTVDLMATGSRNQVGRKVGELATATGLTVRTLRYYEEIGLLAASGRSGGGHRLYAVADVERLYRICLLRRLGLPLAEVGRVLDDPAWSIGAAMAHHLRELDRRLDATARLRSLLAHVIGSLGSDRVPNAEDLLDVLEGMTMLETTLQRRISILVYEDLEAAYEFLTGVFGLGPGQLARDEEGKVIHGEVQTGDGVVWLHPESPEFGLASPRSLDASTAMVAVMVEDVDAHFRHAADHGASIVYEPVDQPYGYREYSARDCEGGLWSFMKPLD